MDAWIRWDLYKRGVISDDIAITNTVPHHYVCLPADCQHGTVPQILTVRGVGGEEGGWVGACGLITESAIWFPYQLLVLVC